MAALTPTFVAKETLGSLNLQIYSMTTSSTSDTVTIDSDLPVVAYWINGNQASAGKVTSPDISYVSTTGVFTLVSVSGNYGVQSLFILCRGF